MQDPKGMAVVFNHRDGNSTIRNNRKQRLLTITNNQNELGRGSPRRHMLLASFIYKHPLHCPRCQHRWFLHGRIPLNSPRSNAYPGEDVFAYVIFRTSSPKQKQLWRSGILWKHACSTLPYPVNVHAGRTSAEHGAEKIHRKNM